MTALGSARVSLDEADPSTPSFARVVVCIPAFNEENTVGSVVKAARRFANHVIVCDDGSADKTSVEALKNGGVVVKHPRNLGKGAALRTLIQEASKFGPDVLVTLDGDGQHDPTEVPWLLAPILDGTADVVIGSRFDNGNKIPRYRRAGNYILTALTNFSAKTSIRDTQSGFRAYSSKVIPYLSISANGMGVDSEILVRVAGNGIRIAERDVTVSYEGDTSTFNPISHTLRVIWTLARVQVETRGYKAFRLPLFLMLCFSTILSLLVRMSVGFPLSGFSSYILGFSAAGLIAAFTLNGRLSRRIKRSK